MSEQSVQIPFVTDANPTESGFYQVNRDALGMPFRHFTVETGIWSRCEYLPAEAVASQEKPSAVGFLPWRGPVNMTKLTEADAVVGEGSVSAGEPVPAKTTKEEKAAAKAAKAAASAAAKAEKAAASAAAKAAKEKAKAEQPAPTVPAEGALTEAVATSATKHPDGTIFFRADRQKWIAMWGGKQEAARNDVQACKNFLAKKYGFTAYVVLNEPKPVETKTEETQTQESAVTA